MGDDTQGGSGARQARAAGHAGRDDGGLGAARSGRRAGATDRDGWPRRNCLCAGLDDDGSAHGGVAQRAGGALDRAVRGAPLRLLPGRRAGLADRAGQRRMAGTVRPGDAGRADPRLRRRRPIGCGDDGPADRPPERPGASPGRGGGRGAAARIDGRPGELGAPGRRDPRPHPQLHQRRGGRHRAECGGRDEWLRRRAGAGPGPGRRGRTAERHRGGLRPPGRRRLPSRSGDGRIGRALGDRAQLLPAARLLQPDLFGAGRAGRHPHRAPAAPRRDRAHRRGHLPVRREHARARPRQLFRGQILAAPRGRRAGAARPRGLSRLHRRGRSRSRDRRPSSPDPCPRGPRAERPRAATQAGARHRDLERRPPSHPPARERPRRLPGSVSRGRDPREIPRAGGRGARPSRRGPRGGPRRSPRRPPPRLGDLVVALRRRGSCIR